MMGNLQDGAVRQKPGVWLDRGLTGLGYPGLAGDGWWSSLSVMKSAFPEPEIVTRKGKPVSVILPLKDYQELLERVEDAADVTWLKKARRKPQRYRPLNEYLAARSGS
jgi:hypothetical protein